MMTDTDLHDRLRRYGEILDRAAVEYEPAVVADDGPARRPLLLAAAAGVVVLGLVGVGLAASSGDPTVRTTPFASTGTIPDVPAGTFPRFLIEGWELTGYDEASVLYDDGTQQYNVYRDPALGHDGPSVAVRTIHPAESLPPQIASDVDVDGRPGTTATIGLVRHLVFDPIDGVRVQLTSIRLDPDELEAVARGLERWPDGTGWEPTELPSGLERIDLDSPEPGERHRRTARASFAAGRWAVQLRLEQRPASVFEELVEYRAKAADQLSQVELLGLPAAVTHDRGEDRWSAMWYADGIVYELEGWPADEEAFFGALAGLRAVEQAPWEAALPESVITPSERPIEVDAMLADVPLPPGFNVEALKTGSAVRERYSVGARVVGAVGCAWIDRWAASRESEDAASVAAAVAAMATSHSWPVLLEMDTEGDYPDLFWDIADRMAAGETTVIDEGSALCSA